MVMEQVSGSAGMLGFLYLPFDFFATFMASKSLACVFGFYSLVMQNVAQGLQPSASSIPFEQ